MKFTYFSMLIVSSFFVTNLVAQCYKDSDCPGNLICNGQGECVNPSEKQESSSTAKVTTTSSSGNTNTIGIYIIPKFGVNIAKIHGDFINESTAHPKGGILLGAGLSLALNSYFSLEPGLNFSMRGQKYRELDYEYLETYEINLRINYLEFPLKATLTIPTGTLITPSAFFAPVLSFRLSAEAEESIGDESHSENIKDDIQAAEFGIAFGGGASAEIQKMLLTFETRFLFGLTDVFEDVDNCKTWVISFVVGVGFKVK